VWWHTSVIPAFGRLRQEDCWFKVSLSHSEYQARVVYSKNPIKKKKKRNKMAYWKIKTY
jgi:hypothetical protein